MNRYKFIDEGKVHLHTLDGKPLIGTSTISKIIGGGQSLQWWASSKAVETLGWIKKEYAPDDKYKKNCLNEQERIIKAEEYRSQIIELDSRTYLKLLDIAYKAHSVHLKSTAEKGVDLHALLEKYVKSEINKTPLDMKTEEYKLIDPFVVWSIGHVKRWLFSELHVYSEQLWTGGIIDAGYISNDNDGNKFVLVDFKSGGAYIQGFIQAGGYALQLEENMCGFDKNGNITWDNKGLAITDSHPNSLAIFPFKGGFKEPVFIHGQTHKYMDAFEQATKLYKLSLEFNEVMKNG